MKEAQCPMLGFFTLGAVAEFSAGWLLARAVDARWMGVSVALSLGTALALALLGA